MTKLLDVEVRIPHRTRTPAHEVGRLLDAAPLHAPFDDILIDYCAEFARQLSRRSQGYAELQALAFWMRRSELVRLRTDFKSLLTERTMLMPRGMVFHIPPANVDTIFIYSWLLSLLCGNRNIIRLSSRSSEQTELILTIIEELAKDERFESVSQGVAMVSYGHDEETTSLFSRISDLRVIWGGDATVSAVRRSPLAPHASDLTFPDRVSLAVLDAGKIDTSSDDQLAEIAERFYNDAFWFNQLGCSSPRMVVWVGDQETFERASQRFFVKLHEVTIVKGLIVEPGTAIAKLTFGYGVAVRGDASLVTALGSQVLVVQDATQGFAPEDFVGAGTFHSTRVDELNGIVSLITRKVQTLSYHGFDSEQLRALIARISGRGVDRIVPIGQALTFNRYWDGNDLLQSFTRRVYFESAH